MDAAELRTEAAEERVSESAERWALTSSTSSDEHEDDARTKAEQRERERV